ncbi:hypothetical protein [Kitasatospora azatica]|uniref:hypothetical protein n=1 Tax=Kitasatospora azatica TaxID=58347 RepID=UPI00056C3953|nr:hypothetical protein [Kitasatospora azatica]
MATKPDDTPPYNPGPATLRPDTPDTSIFNQSGPDGSVSLPSDISNTYPGYDGSITIYHTQRSPELVSKSRGLIKLLAGNYTQIESQLKQTTAPTFKPAPVNPDFNPNDPNTYKFDPPPPPPDQQSFRQLDPTTSGLPDQQFSAARLTGDSVPATSFAANPLGQLTDPATMRALDPMQQGFSRTAGFPGGDPLTTGGPGTHLQDFSQSGMPLGSEFTNGPVTSFDPNAFGPGGSFTPGGLGLSRLDTGPGGQLLGPGGMSPLGLGSGLRTGPNGELLGPDGQPIGPPGTHLGPNGELLGPNGELLGPPGTRLGPNGELIGPNGEILPPGTRLGPNGELFGPNGERLGPNGRPLGTGRTTGLAGELGPNGERLGPNGELLGPNGLPLSAAERAALGEQQGLAAAERAALGERAALAEGAGGLGMGPGGMPMMPGMGGMGGMGAGQGDRSRTTWLEEDRDVWGADNDALLGAIGRFELDEE